MGRTIFFLFIVISFLVSGSVVAATKELKTEVITLYDIGMMQVEKHASVKGDKEIKLKVSIANMDDLLTSLMVFTEKNVKVKGVNYPTVQNLGQALASGSIGQSMSGDGEEPAFPGDLNSTIQTMIGTDVIVKLQKSKPVRGTIMGVVDDKIEEIDDYDESDIKVQRTNEKKLILVQPNGSLIFIELKDVKGIEFVSKRESRSLKNLAGELAKSNGFRESEITFKIKPGGKGKLAATYMQQVPKWRTWYRLNEQNGELWLEGWAQVHNDTSEDWVDVDMTLVSGLPYSYLISAATPRYGQRESMELENEGAMMPQLGALTADRLLYDYSPGTMGYGGLGLSGYGRGAGGLSGRRGRSPSFSSGAAYAGYQSSSLVSVENSAIEQLTEAAVEEEISTYKVLSKVNIKAGTSAMVPVIKKKIDGKIFSLISTESNKVNRCVYLENQTGLVLQYGLMSIYSNGNFKGQSELTRTEPNDSTLLCYAEDMDVDYEVKSKVVKRSVKQLEWFNETLFTHSIVKTTFTYTLNNRAGQERQLGLTVSFLKNGRVLDSEGFKVLGKDNQLKIKFLPVALRASKTFEVTIEEARREQKEMSQELVESLLESDTLEESDKKILSDWNEQKKEVVKIQEATQKIKVKVKHLTDSLRTDRKNLSFLPDIRRRKRVAAAMHESIVKKSNDLETLKIKLDKSIKLQMKKQDSYNDILEGLNLL
jgi:hypothetical protein